MTHGHGDLRPPLWPPLRGAERTADFPAYGGPPRPYPDGSPFPHLDLQSHPSSLTVDPQAPLWEPHPSCPGSWHRVRLCLRLPWHR